MRSVVYKLRGDASGANCGPLTLAEMAEIDGWSDKQLKQQPGAAEKTSQYRGVCKEYVRPCATLVRVTQ